MHHFVVKFSKISSAWAARGHWHYQTKLPAGALDFDCRRLRLASHESFCSRSHQMSCRRRVTDSLASLKLRGQTMEKGKPFHSKSWDFMGWLIKRTTAVWWQFVLPTLPRRQQQREYTGYSQQDLWHLSRLGRSSQPCGTVDIASQ